MTTQTPEQIAQHFKAMGDSNDLINGIVGGTQLTNASAEDKKSTVSRNVEHLELMVAKDFWTTEDMAATNAAIAAGKAYV